MLTFYSLDILEIYLEQCHLFFFTRSAILNSYFSQIQLCYIHCPACARNIIISKGMTVYSSTKYFNESFQKVNINICEDMRPQQSPAVN